MSEKKIVLISIFANTDIVKYWCKSKYSSWDYLFFSDDYSKLLKWKQKLGSSFNYVSLSKKIDDTASLLRDPYLQWIAKIGESNSETAWWSSRISEKNTMVSSLFDDICRLHILKEYCKSNQKSTLQKPTLVIIENFLLLSTLSKSTWLANKKYKVPFLIKTPWCFSRKMIQAMLVYSKFAVPVLFLYRIFRLASQAIQANFANEADLIVKKSNHKLIIIHTYLEETSFAKNLYFQDRYFPGLHEFYKQQGYQVFVLPVIFNIKRSYFQAWSWMKSSKTLFLNPYIFYKISDYIYAIKVAIRTFKLPIHYPLFYGHNLQSLIDAERSRTIFDSLNQILYLKLPYRLKERGINCHALVAEFENMIPEKMLILGFRKYQPKTILVGFQHGALYPNFLCNFILPEEKAITPMFDKIICNGTIFKDILMKKGLPEERVVIGSALRYVHITTSFQDNIYNPSSKSIDVLVPLPLMINGAIELLNKLIIGLGKQEHSSSFIKVILKAHPMSSISSLLKILGKDIKLPANFEVSNAALSFLLPKTKVVIGFNTCSIFEAAAAQVPIIRLRRETALSLDPFGFFSEMPQTICSIDEIQCEVNRLICLNREEFMNLMKIYKKVISDAFHPYNKDGLTAFLPERS